jgi:glucose-fructose oxidoreductase
MAEKIRYAVVGLGYIAQSAVLPAFAHAKRNSLLTALVSDDPEKLDALGRKYNVEHRATYEEYDGLLGRGAVDAVYLALPNSYHREYTERAARAGVHVLCEKPMAVTESECRSMMQACASAGVKLMVAYRLHFDPANLKAVEQLRRGRIGDVRMFTSEFTMQVGEGDIRLQKALGGGALYDIGVYCINAARSVFQAEPVEVQAMTVTGPDPRFKDVGEMTAAVLRYPGDRLATFVVSFGAQKISRYRVIGTEGHLTLDPGYEIWEELEQEITRGKRTSHKTYPRRDQFAPELVYFSECILNDREPEPSGREGLNDTLIIRGLLDSAERRRPVRLSLEGDEPPEPDQAKRRYRPPRRPGLFKAKAPAERR